MSEVLGMLWARLARKFEGAYPTPAADLATSAVVAFAVAMLVVLLPMSIVGSNYGNGPALATGVAMLFAVRFSVKVYQVARRELDRKTEARK